MVKYDGFQQKVVHAYLAGEGGYTAISTRLGVPSVQGLLGCLMIIFFNIFLIYKKHC